MKAKQLTRAVVLGVGLCVTTLVAGAATEPPTPAPAAADGRAGTGTPVVEAAPGTNAPIYQPPRRGTPKGRVGGGARGPRDAAPYVMAIAPPHVGLTANDQPTLYWYLSDRASKPLELTLTDDQSVEPLLELALDNPSPGIHAIDLSRLGVRLEPGKSYQWSVAVVVDPEHRSSDVLSSAWMEYAVTDQDLRSRVEKASTEQAVFLYAQAGYWYDAYAALSELIETHPGDAALSKQRVALLNQADLPVVSEYVQDAGAAARD